MGWRFWRSDEPAQDDDWHDVEVRIIDRPASTAPGSPLPCRNDGDPVRVGEPVHLMTSFQFQLTTIRAIRVNGVDSEVLESDQLGDVVLGEDVDLSQVFRSSTLVSSDPAGDWPDGSFVMQVQRAEPRGEDALVVGRVAVGTSVEPGTRVVCSEGPGEEPPYVEVRAVEPAGAGELGLVLGGVSADRFQLGDEVIHVELP